MFLNIIQKFSSFLFYKLKKIPGDVYKLCFAIAFSLVITSYNFDTIEMFFFDLRTIAKAQLKINQVSKTPIVIVMIDAGTVEKNKGFPNFNVHSKFINKIANTKNSNVVYNFRIEDKQFVDISGTYDEKFNFAQAANKHNNVYFLTTALALPGQEEDIRLHVPLNTINVVSGPKTSDSQLTSKNPISRRIPISYEGQQLIHHRISAIYNNEISDKKNISGIYEFLGTEQTYITFNPKSTFIKYKFEDILDEKFDLSKLDNKLILVGTDTKKFIEDYVSSPYSSETADLITTTELHANMFQTLISNNAPTRTGKAFNILLTIAIAFLTIYAALSVKPSRGIVLLLSAFFVILIISTVLLGFFDIWINLAHPLLTIFLCYYFFIPYRLIIENRRSWEYFQKNKLLHQVEELKTNFISMMSHDLKTPIARIQGMTEVILKDDVTLSPIQREAVDTIKGSSDDLLKFINSILQYGRIESQGVELHKQSKDINQVLADVVRKHEFLAKVKKIKVHTELEPMFPIQIDVELMKQVLSNLVENAIKYSHEESSVTVKSREEGSLVVIEVTDNGVGIPAEDLPNIFMKFYRSHNVKTSTIKGTGLGLYLAKYFAELHKGDITVTSEVGKGSTFKLTLPA